jgi:two-component system, OmpR family, response regulator CpxR
MNTLSIPAGNSARRRRVLICDDDLELAQLLSEYLSQHDLDIACVSTAEQAIEMLKRDADSLDALVLDLMLPGIDGLTALKRIRQTNDLPVLMMSARGEPIDRVIGLELGADDYLSKPCFPRELLARLHVLMRRGQDVHVLAESSAEIVLGNLRLQPSQRHAWLAGIQLHLTGAEYTVLWTLARDAGKFVSREKLTSTALHRPLERFDRAIDVHVSRLRKKLQQLADDAPVINSARGTGYVLVCPAVRS